MAYRDMLRNRAYVMRPTVNPATRNTWNQNEGPAAAVPPVAPVGDGTAIPCYHTAASGSRTVTIEGQTEQITVTVDLDLSEDVQGADILCLDDGRNVRVLDVRIVAGGHHKIADCRQDGKYAHIRNAFRG